MFLFIALWSADSMGGASFPAPQLVAPSVSRGPPGMYCQPTLLSRRQYSTVYFKGICVIPSPQLC